MNCPHAVHVGVYLLGARDAERGAFERHLESCLSCQAEVAELAALPALLAAAKPAGDVVAGDIVASDVVASDIVAAVAGKPEPPPDDLLDRVIAQVTAERAARRRRSVALLAAAAMVVIAALAGITFTLRDSTSGQPLQPAQPSALDSGSSPFGVSAKTSVLAQPWGTRIDMTLDGLTPGTSCQLVVRARDGRAETAASWRVTYRSAVQVAGMTSIPPADLAEVAVVDQDGRRLITIAVP